jgi:CRP-like cAMP-binding protein
MAAPDTVALLAHVPVFEGLAPDDLERVASVAVPRSFEPGQVVFREGDDSDTCYVVFEGHARALRTHSDGRTITLATFGAGEVFGELAMFDDEKRSATVEAIDAVEAIAILGPDMRRVLREHPEISAKLVTTLGRRLRAANERLASQSFQTVQSRVAQVISQLVVQEQAEAGGDAEAIGNIVLTITQAEVAQLAGSSRESASRFLAVLERAGIVSQGRGKVTVHDATALERYVF